MRSSVAGDPLRSDGEGGALALTLDRRERREPTFEGT
jgi:hypothetical protein